MNQYLPDHLELTAPNDKFMKLSSNSTHYSSTYKSYTIFDSFTNAETFTTLDSNIIHFLQNNHTLSSNHPKEAIKKLTKRPTLHQKYQNHPKEPNMLQNSQLQKKLKNQQQKFLSPTSIKDESIQYLEVRCVQLDEQLRQLKLKQRKATNSFNRGHKMNNQYISKALLTIQPQIQNPLGQTNRPTQSCSNLIAQKAEESKTQVQQAHQKSSHFVDKLKRKLNEEIQKIKQSSPNNKEIHAGCSIKQPKCTQARDAIRKSLTQRFPSKTFITRSGVQISYSDSTKREKPQTSKQRILQQQEMKFKIEQLDEQEKLELRGIKIEAKKQLKAAKTTNNRYSQPDVEKTFRHIRPLYKQVNWSVTTRDFDREKAKEKMLNILIECQGESRRRETLQAGIKVFQRFSKKMTRKLGKKQRLLQVAENVHKSQQDDACQAYQ